MIVSTLRKENTQFANICGLTTYTHIYMCEYKYFNLHDFSKIILEISNIHKRNMKASLSLRMLIIRILCNYAVLIIKKAITKAQLFLIHYHLWPPQKWFEL